MVVAVLGASIALGGIDVDACGDKFLRVGRGAHFHGYAATYPASILIYKPANAKPKGIQELADLLKRAGHRPSIAEQGTAVARTSATSFDLVIASYPDALKLRHELLASRSRPDVLPILNKPTKELAAEAYRQFPHLLLPHAMTNPEALAEIDRLMERRREGAGAAAPPGGG
jgi:hypothetical protein